MPERQEDVMGRLGRVLRIKQITSDMVRGMPDTVFVLDDNMQRISPNGQAAAMRAEPNVVGLPTRWHLGVEASAFFSDDDWRSNGIFQTVSEAFDRVERALIDGRNVVFPSDELGGSTDLRRRAPLVHAFISTRILELEADYR